MTQRCFIALEPPEAVAKSLREHLRHFSTQAGVRWVRPDNLHLTMLFIGDTPTEKIPEIGSTLARLSSQWEAPCLSLTGFTLFPARDPHLVWAMLSAEDDAIFGMHKAMLKSIRAMGCDPDSKPLKLHITLGRIKHALPLPLEQQIIASSVKPAPLLYQRLTLYRSVLGPEGPTYHILHQFELNTRR